MIQWTNNFLSNTSEEVQQSVHSLTMMVHSLLESSEDVSSRLANLEDRLARTTMPATDTIEVGSVFEGLSLTTSTPALSTYQQLAIEAQEISTTTSEAASSTDPELDPHVQRLLQESRVYSRTLRRHSVSTIPWSYRSRGGWSMLSGISLAQISNISVLSIPITASEIWGASHYMDPSVSQPLGIDKALVNKRLRAQKLSEIIPLRSPSISQSFGRLRSPFVLDPGEVRRLKEARRLKEVNQSIQNPKKPTLLLVGMAINRSDLA